MRPAGRLRCSLFIGLFLFVFSGFSLVLLLHLSPDLTPSLTRKEFPGGGRWLVKNGNSGDSTRLNSIEEEADDKVEEPTRVVYIDDNFSGPLPRSNSSVEDVRSPDTAQGGQSGTGGSGELHEGNVSSSTSAEMHGLSSQAAVGEDNSDFRIRSWTRERIWDMEDQLIMAKAYLHFAPQNSHSHLVRELKLRIRDTQRLLDQSSKGSSLSRSAVQKIRAMEETLSKAQKAYPDCTPMSSKLRAMTHNTEELLRAQQSEASYLLQVVARTVPKGYHCLTMRLTSEYFALANEERELPNINKLHDRGLYHYAMFSDNILACAVTVNSTVSTSKEPDKIVFHVVTDSLNFPAMMMWFLLNPAGQATIHVESLDDFKWLPSNFSLMFKLPGLQDPRFTSPLNHLRFRLPEIFPSLSKVLLLDHDVVVQRDLSELWLIDMKGGINGAVETCKTGNLSHRLRSFVNFSDPIIARTFNPEACIWAFGMNLFDLKEWRAWGLTSNYHKWLQVGRRREIWKAGSLPLGQLVFYNHTMALDRRWHVLGLGRDRNLPREELESAAAIHYDGKLKPWLDIAIKNYRGYWTKFLDFDNAYLQQCNIHE